MQLAADQNSGADGARQICNSAEDDEQVSATNKWDHLLDDLIDERLTESSCRRGRRRR